MENVLERAVILSSGDTLTANDFSADIMPVNIPTVDWRKNMNTLAHIEREHILKVLRETHGNKTRAAEKLGITKKTLYSKLKSYGMFPVV